MISLFNYDSARACPDRKPGSPTDGPPHIRKWVEEKRGGGGEGGEGGGVEGGGGGRKVSKRK